MARLTKINTEFVERRQEIVNGLLKTVEKMQKRSHFDELELVKKINEIVDAINNLNDNVFK